MSRDEPATEHVDVLIVGAGISGVDAAYRLKTRCPERSWLILSAVFLLLSVQAVSPTRRWRLRRGPRPSEGATG